MEVKLRLSDGALNEASLRAAVKQKRLDVTVYSEGFERGLYATVSALTPKALFRVRSNARSNLAGLEQLIITDVATRLDQQAASFLLMQPNLTPQPSAREESEWVNVRVEGLEPGVAYTFRSSGARSIVTCYAASCPFDKPPVPREQYLSRNRPQ